MCDPNSEVCKLDAKIGSEEKGGEPSKEPVLQNATSPEDKPLFKYYGADWCPDCVRVKKYLHERGIVYLEYDTDVVGRPNIGKSRIPTLVFEDGSFLQEPSNEELAEKLKSLE